MQSLQQNSHAGQGPPQTTNPVSQGQALSRARSLAAVAEYLAAVPVAQAKVLLKP